jgi:Tc5 transposase DNA-binding domain
MGIHQEQLISMANSILKQDHINDGEHPTVGEHWSHHFLLRHPELHKMKQKPIKLVRKMTHDPMLITNWFSRFYALREEFAVANCYGTNLARLLMTAVTQLHNPPTEPRAKRTLPS